MEIKKALESMYSLDTGIKGVQGYIYFDENETVYLLTY